MSEFDRDCITYTQEGRILQIEYATKAVESSEYFDIYSGPLLELSVKMEL